MNIGSLYKVKKCFWLLFPTKETASEDALVDVDEDALVDGVEGATVTAVQVAILGAWYRKRYNCDVTYFPLDSIVVFLEEDGFLKKVLTSEGLIGWTWFNESYNHCFEEVETEES